MTPFKLLMIATGLSQRQAAEYLDCAPSHIDNMSRGKSRPTDGIMAEMRALYAKQQRAAAELLAMVGEIEAKATIELGLASDDHEARSLGWPSTGAQAGALAMVVASADRAFRIVPSGSTPATALAADQHGK